MTIESLEELRRRLLQQESVQRMIQMRAYEIYQMRGCQPGGEARDWFHAEGEVLAFLIANESTQAAEPAATTDQVTEAPKGAAIQEELQEEPVKKRPATKSRSPRSAQGTKTTRQSTADKQAATKKSTKPKTKSVRPRNASKQESTE